MKLSVATVSITLMSICFSYAQPVASITMDDGVTNDMPGGYPLEVWNKMILDNLASANLKIIFFSTGKNKTDERGRYLLTEWNKQGHRIGNHSYTHPRYDKKEVTFAMYKREFLQADSVTRQYSNYIRMYRFPHLKEGDTREKIDQFRATLKEHNYKNGHVTIDVSDWYIDSRLRKKLKEGGAVDLEAYKKFYLKHMYDRAVYYENLAFKLTGRHIKHTLLIHHNLTSALFLDDLISLLKEKGWTLINAEEAFKDEIFEKSPSNIPAGESLIWALAEESGNKDFKLRYPAEDGEYLRAEMDALGL